MLLFSPAEVPTYSLFNDRMWTLYLVNAFQASILTNLVPFATSDWESHSLLTVIYIVSNAMTAAVYIPLAKMLDLWGRAEGFVLMVAFATLGIIMMAAGNSLTTFCAAQVLPHPQAKFNRRPYAN